MKSLVQLALCFVLISGIADAKDEGKSLLGKDQEQTLIDSVPAPPAAGSDADKADLAQVLEAQKDRNEAVIAECKRDQKFDYTLFESIYGADVGKDPAFVTLMKDVLATTKGINESAKNKYKRPRPYEAHPDQVKALFTVTGFSYPSGHSMGSYTLAVVLGSIFPDKKQAFLDRAAQIAQSRVDAGVHNPSDIAEGKTLGLATGNAIVASPLFQTDISSLQKK